MIKIFYGPSQYFTKETKDKDGTSLSELIEKSDIKKIRIEGVPATEEDSRPQKINTLIIHSDEYSRLSDSGFNSFRAIIEQFKITDFYIQNPPQKIISLLKKIRGHKVYENYYSYPQFTINELEKISKQFNVKILGQESAKRKLQSGIYRLVKKYNKDKPLVIMFYGPTGVGKTETAKYLADTLGGTLFRKQFSMYQNNSFSDYLFGASHSSASFAQELLERESNVILIDEFDKANPLFYSAFYQVFDEGLFSDKNYTVHLENSIIICTSNFTDIKQMKQVLGEPIYNRFDLMIEFRELNLEASSQIIEKKYNEIINSLDNEDKKLLKDSDCLGKLLKNSDKLKNVRAINRVVSDAIFETILSQRFPAEKQ
ncbi:AAA family ATPase [Streptococcus suis]|nr:AAA family ATPase [Streptococcus suis]